MLNLNKKNIQKIKKNWDINLDGFSGNMEKLINNTKKGKIEIKKIIVKDIAQHYLNIISTKTNLDLNYAMSNIVKAISLILMKSNKMLLKKQNTEDELIITKQQEIIIEWRAQKNRIMKNCIKRMQMGNILERNIFAKGEKSKKEEMKKIPPEIKLIELIRAYKNKGKKLIQHKLKIKIIKIISLKQALQHVTKIIENNKKWMKFENVIYPKKTKYLKNSEKVVTFISILTLAKQGDVKIKQQNNFAEIYLKANENK